VTTTARHAAYDVELLDIGLSVAHKENNAVTLSKASDLTTILVGFEYRQGANDHWWFVYAEPGASRQVILPELPALITDGLEVDDLSSKFTAYTVSGFSYEAAPRYTDWIEQGAKRSHDNVELYRSPVNMKSLSLPLK
jgi:hypothetical protein